MNQNCSVIWAEFPLLFDLIAQYAAPFGAGSVLGPANVFTYRTPDFLLSSAQDYNGGLMAGQQHVWQLTFDPDSAASTVFSHQPLTDVPDDVSI